MREGREAHVALRGDHAVTRPVRLRRNVGHEAAEDIIVVAQHWVAKHRASMRKCIVRLLRVPLGACPGARRASGCGRLA
eukprot:10720769-Alexandrium_andersonii.AAC.1